MSGALTIAAGLGACCCAATTGALLAEAWCERRARRALREAALGNASRGLGLVAPPTVARGLALRYAETLTRRLYAGATEPLTPSVREGRADKTRAGERYRQLCVSAGCAKDVSTAAFCEARTRLTVAGGLAGGLAGAVFSGEMAIALGIAGAIVCRTAPMRELRAARRERAIGAERHLSEMLEVVSLGLRSGLTFDRSFALYGSHFQSEFAQTCAKAHRRWSLGLTTREEALRELADSYDCDQLNRSVESVVRSLRFGSALAGVLEEGAAQSRAAYRTALEERVAKAPVKMMLPTGALILPAMLLLVMGPILLELAGGF